LTYLIKIFFENKTFVMFIQFLKNIRSTFVYKNNNVPAEEGKGGDVAHILDDPESINCPKQRWGGGLLLPKNQRNFVVYGHSIEGKGMCV
jgi:hypothetical protein